MRKHRRDNRANPLYGIVFVALLVVVVGGAMFLAIAPPPKPAAVQEKTVLDPAKFKPREGYEVGKGAPGSTVTEKLSFGQAVGKRAPDFSLEGTNGELVRLRDYRGKIVVLFFNEGAMCKPACWDQMAIFGNDERFNTNGVVAFSVVVDTKSEWKKILNQEPQLSKAKILFDTSRAVSSAYDVLSLESSMHPGSLPGHTYFVIDKDGVIRYAMDDPSMGIWSDKLINEIQKLR